MRQTRSESPLRLFETSAGQQLGEYLSRFNRGVAPQVEVACVFSSEVGVTIRATVVKHPDQDALQGRLEAVVEQLTAALHGQW